MSCSKMEAKAKATRKLQKSTTRPGVKPKKQPPAPVAKKPAVGKTPKKGPAPALPLPKKRPAEKPKGPRSVWDRLSDEMGVGDTNEDT